MLTGKYILAAAALLAASATALPQDPAAAQNNNDVTQSVEHTPTSVQPDITPATSGAELVSVTNPSAPEPTATRQITASCSFFYKTTLGFWAADSGFGYFHVSMYNWGDDPRGCGRGLLDNVRGQTTGSEASDWTCNREKEGVDVANFQVSSIYRDAGKRVEDAIYLASPGGNLTNVECRRSKDLYWG